MAKQNKSKKVNTKSKKPKVKPPIMPKAPKKAVPKDFDFLIEKALAFKPKSQERINKTGKQ
ncbi:MAG: hypothetical protein LUH63_14675 [Parabacteroides sp.]|nr:hypothetical protein [Parabacteroides sp.]